jgi:hypothetical protein
VLDVMFIRSFSLSSPLFFLKNVIAMPENGFNFNFQPNGGMSDIEASGIYGS